MKKLFVLSFICLFTKATMGQDVNKLINQEDVTHIIKTLSADDMLGRDPFSPSIEKTAKFIEGEYAQAGLKPLMGNTTYRQKFNVFRSSYVKTTATINGINIGADSVFTLAVNSFNWAGDNTGVQIIHLDAGKDLIAEYLAYAQSDKKLIITVDPLLKRQFKRIREHVLEGSVNINDNGQQIVFVLGKFDDIKSFNVDYEGKTEKAGIFNIAGVIPGKTKPGEYVIFSAHYDHLGVLKSEGGDSIANGADDDASGVTAVISLAKYYKKLNNNARTLVFVAFTAEEVGEVGSQYFATQINPDKVTAMFNIEMIGKASKFGTNSAFITGFDKSDFGSILQKNLEGSSFKFYPDPYPEEELFYRSDNASLAEAGVPAHSISTDQIDIDKLYHTVKDEFSTLDVGNITSTIKAIALSSRTIISGKDTPKRVPKREK